MYMYVFERRNENKLKHSPRFSFDFLFVHQKFFVCLYDILKMFSYCSCGCGDGRIQFRIMLLVIPKSLDTRVWRMCCRYGYVEFRSRKDAERALNQHRRLEVDRCRIDVQLFNKVPSLLSDEMRGTQHTVWRHTHCTSYVDACVDHRIPW